MTDDSSPGAHGAEPGVSGRSAVVRPGQPAPGPWAACERVPVTSVDAGVADTLHRAWRERTPLVIELSPGAGLDDPAVPPPETRPGLQPWDWYPDLDLPAERLHHAIWANSVDARASLAGGGPVWRWAQEAQRLGAAPAPPGSGADVLLADGTPAVCDGGPLDASLADRLGLPVIHRFGLEHGSLRRLGRPGEEAPSSLALDGATALAPDQWEAVHEPRGGSRVIAPAGSGKTRVLTERARLMIDTWGLPPAALALVAYNVRAAGEMRDRLAALPQLRIRTLNAMALRLCGRSQTIDERQVRNILSSMLPLPRRADSDPVAPWLEALSRVRLGLAHPEDVETGMTDISGLGPVAVDYRERLAAAGQVDFDEQVVAAIERLLSDPAFRVRSQRFARVLLVDEFQDLTPAHLLLIRLLSGPAGSVFAVGDDDQTIYGYAGASPRWLVDFQTWFPGSASHALEVNYRCPPSVVNAAATLLAHNRVRVPKTIRSPEGTADPATPDSARPDPGVSIISAGAGGAGPSTRTADRVADLLGTGVPPSAVAVLSRVNASLVPVQVLLSHRGVPVQTRGAGHFLTRSGVRAAMAWLQVATAPSRSLPTVALTEAARRPKRGMSNGLLQLIGRSRTVDGLEGLVGWLDRKGSARDADKVEALVADVARARRAADGGDTAAILEVVRHQIGLDDSAEALDSWGHGAIAAHMDDLEALSEVAGLEPDPARFPIWLAEQLQHPGDPAGVTLASVHAVKGREWPHVIVHHATDGLFPHRLADDEEEERRVFHVAITRAVTGLTVVAGDPPSPFLDEMAGRSRPTGSKVGRPRAGRPAAQPAAGSPVAGGSVAGAKAVRPAGPAPLTASVGLEFASRGHDHRVVEVTPEGAMCEISGSPARTLIRWGTSVAGPAGSAVLAHPSAEEAFERLKAWRSAEARRAGKPAFVVFDDRTLKELAARLPTTEAGLLNVTGIGPAKLEAYGTALIELAEELTSARGAQVRR